MTAAGKSCISNQVRFQGLVFSYPACALGFHVIMHGKLFEWLQDGTLLAGLGLVSQKGHDALMLQLQQPLQVGLWIVLSALVILCMSWQHLVVYACCCRKVPRSHLPWAITTINCKRERVQLVMVLLQGCKQGKVQHGIELVPWPVGLTMLLA